jgi:isopentenyl-diphosphate delta-isomerase
MSAAESRRVSFEDEPLIVVDEENNVLGHRTKAECHDGEGILHRAFSVFIFNDRGELLLQQRSADKRLWPMFWSNSCCSHPRRGETEDEAAGRRIEEELGIATALERLFTFQYHAAFEDKGSEREVCTVFLGRTSDPIRANEHEIADWKWISVEELEAGLESDGGSYTPWLKMEWARMRSEFTEALARYTKP